MKTKHSQCKQNLALDSIVESSLEDTGSSVLENEKSKIPIYFKLKTNQLKLTQQSLIKVKTKLRTNLSIENLLLRFKMIKMGRNQIWEQEKQENPLKTKLFKKPLYWEVTIKGPNHGEFRKELGS